MTAVIQDMSAREKAQSIFDIFNSESLTDEQYSTINPAKLAEQFRDKKIRDGIMRMYIELDDYERTKFINALLIIAISAVANNKTKLEDCGYINMMVSCLLMIKHGFEHRAGEDVTDKQAEVLKTVRAAISLGCEDTILPLLEVSLSHNVPPTVFLESVEAITLEDCLGEK